MGYFKGKQLKKDIILIAVGYYCRFSLKLSRFNLTFERTWNIGSSYNYHALGSWIWQYQMWKKKNKSALRAWHLDETYIKIKGEWCYLYRAVDKGGHTLDIQLRKKWNHQASYTFMKRLGKHFWEPNGSHNRQDSCSILYVQKIKV